MSGDVHVRFCESLRGRFPRATRRNIFVRSPKAANRVMESISEFIEGKLKLKINREKSRVGRSKDVKFLGMTVINGAIAISAQSMKRALEKVKELTPRGTHMPLELTIQRINNWYKGWADGSRWTPSDPMNEPRSYPIVEQARP
ncbi:hypothetical protein [uncultured Desulfobacter sp.]|uniref:hypothetical protein n=1 Tax=uncultured Desulfobacter sp. TaxID=240139 RepID=UPI002AA8E2D1|nr:hypothetical protein [uncultured Desulfobacter sp.]